MEERITKERLFEKKDALNNYITDALSIYSGLRKTELTGVEGFKYAARKKEDSTQINENDFSAFFNKILVVDYLQKNNINIFSLSDEEKRNLQAEISEKVFNSIVSEDRNQIVVKSDGVNKDSLDYEFVLNSFKCVEISALESLYDLAKKANIPYCIAINSDFSVSFNDTITVGCSKEYLDQTLAVLNEFVAKSSDILLPPMRFVKSVGDVIGFREVLHENTDVYTEVYNSLIKAIDDTLAAYGQVPENDLDRYKKLDAFSLADAKTMLIENLKSNLMNSRLDLENYGSLKKIEPEVQLDETVIKVAKPTVAFEEIKDVTSPEPIIEEAQADTPIFNGESNSEIDSTDKALDDFLNTIIPKDEAKEPEEIIPTESTENSLTSSQNDESIPEEESSSLTEEEIDALMDEVKRDDQQRIFEGRARKYKSVVDDIDLLNTEFEYNGEQISLLDYLDNIDILNKIPLDATVSTASGKKSGKEFIRDCVIPYAVNKPDNDLDSIMIAYGAKLVKERNGILSKLFK